MLKCTVHSLAQRLTLSPLLSQPRCGKEAGEGRLQYGCPLSETNVFCMPETFSEFGTHETAIVLTQLLAVYHEWRVGSEKTPTPFCVNSGPVLFTSQLGVLF